MISLGMVIKAINILCVALEVADKAITIAKKAGFLRETQDVKALGEKVLMAKEMGMDNPENPEEYEEYMNKIDSLKVDPAMKDKYSDLEKIEAASKILVYSLANIYPDVKNLAEFLQEVKDNPEFYTVDRMEKYLKNGNDEKLDMAEIGKYLSGSLENDPEGMVKERRLRQLLKEIEAEMGNDGTEVIDKEMERRDN